MALNNQIKEFNKIIKKYPDIKDFYLARALLYEKAKQYKKALQDYKKVFQTFTCLDIASICEKNDLIKEAENIYTKAIKADKTNSNNYLRRAYFYRRNGEIKKALTDCERGLKISPNNEIILMLKKILKEN